MDNKGIELENPEMVLLRNNKDSGWDYRERRHSDWRENYQLYRDKVTVNRLTQRQSVNLPLMKQTIRTLIKDVDDLPVLYFENLDNDKQAEVFQNEFWKVTSDQNKMEMKDIVDKRQVFIYGRSFDQMQIVDGKVKFDIIDPEDILVDRFVDPTDIDTARFVIHTHIFLPLSTIEANSEYDRGAISALKQFYGTTEGIIKQNDNKESLTEKNNRMVDLGMDNVDDPILGETYVELSLHFVKRGEVKEGGRKYPEQIWLYVEADDQVILQKKPLEQVIGKTSDHFWRDHYPYNSWADDLDKQDFWSDGIADIVRTPNKVLNSWFSQMVENRTLRNFGMHYYDSSLKAEGFQPNTFNPVAWGWYPVPGKPSEVLQKVDIPDLSESLDEMTFIVKMLETATGSNPVQQGAYAPSGTPLGEVQLALGEAKARVQSMSKFYTQCWKDRGTKFLKLIEAAPEKIDMVKIFKKGRNTGNIFSREIEPKDWMTKNGYNAKVWSQDEKQSQDTKSLEKLNAVIMNIPTNTKLREIYNRKLLEFAELSPDEIIEIMDEEKKKLMPAMPGTPQAQAMQMQPQPQVAPPVQPMAQKPTPKAKKKPAGNGQAVNKLKDIRNRVASMANA